MKATSRTWFAVAGPDGTYGEPQPLGDVIPEIAGDGEPELCADAFRPWSATVEAKVSKADCRWLRRHLGLYRIWELRKRGKRSHKHRRKGNR